MDLQLTSITVVIVNCYQSHFSIKGKTSCTVLAAGRKLSCRVIAKRMQINAELQSILIERKRTSICGLTRKGSDRARRMDELRGEVRSGMIRGSS